MPTARDLGARAAKAVRVMVEDQLPDRAAALTYFGLLALFPGLIVFVAVVELIAGSYPETEVTSMG